MQHANYETVKIAIEGQEVDFTLAKRLSEELASKYAFLIPDHLVAGIYIVGSPSGEHVRLKPHLQSILYPKVQGN